MNEQTVRRTREWVEREYGREKWPAMERLIEGAIAAEEPASELSRVWARVARSEWHGDTGTSPHEIMDAVVPGDLVQASAGFALAAQQALVVDSVLARCRESTGVIVELGSGWGRNIFAAWLGGAPRGARYVAAEYTGAGRRAAERLAALNPHIAFESHSFDYYQPVLATVPRPSHAVVFTVHSVEQIPQLKPEVIDVIRSIADEVDCVHLEPVGWQLETKSGAGSSREYAERHDYNRNLVALLRAAEAAGDIRIEAILPEAVGANPLNATTMIRWRSAAHDD